MPDAKFTFKFSVVANDTCQSTHEPASLPGGYVFVPGALFIEANSEAEFAGMLAHSMEHVAERQSTRPGTRDRIANPENIPLIFMGAWSGGCSEGKAIPAGLLPTGRSHELEADRLAVQAMARAGFDPQALVSYIKRVQTPQTEIFSALPARDERVAAMNLIIERLPRFGYEETTDAFVANRERILRSAEGGNTPRPPR